MLFFIIRLWTYHVSGYIYLCIYLSRVLILYLTIKGHVVDVATSHLAHAYHWTEVIDTLMVVCI